jgi:hypothetical protein
MGRYSATKYNKSCGVHTMLNILYFRLCETATILITYFLFMLQYAFFRHHDDMSMILCMEINEKN